MPSAPQEGVSPFGGEVASVPFPADVCLCAMQVAREVLCPGASFSACEVGLRARADPGPDANFDNPPNLSISLSGGAETKQDSLRNGE